MTETVFLTRSNSRFQVTVGLMGVRGRVGDHLVEDCHETKEVGFLFRLWLSHPTKKVSPMNRFYTVWLDDDTLWSVNIGNDELFLGGLALGIEDDELRCVKEMLNELMRTEVSS